MKKLLFASALAVFGLGASSCIVVVNNTCTDGLQNGNETDVDCGGGTCGACGDGRGCVVSRDCVSGVCNAGTCGTSQVLPTCSDGVRNGNETGVDCGGSCPACPTCTDGVQNGTETGVDCGGSCPACVNFPTGAGATPMTGDQNMIQPNVGSSAPTTGGYVLSVSTGSVDTFRIIATGVGGPSHEFYGSIFSAGGLSGLSTGCAGQCSFSTGDFVSQPYTVAGGQRIDFDIIAPDPKASGFDFDVTTNSASVPVYFDLLIDGQRIPGQVEFTSSLTSLPRAASSMPFSLVVQ
jgi:hypothetical protein